MKMKFVQLSFKSKYQIRGPQTQVFKKIKNLYFHFTKHVREA